ncbi:hypothetical protein KDW_05140 [Dictyobacter vulcani]|uniref:Glycosyltransferase subfamily 4-like N-terminal domain-containing protein n=2 Tax=Dictyobacter vulcani TaxID=2607529 RepID=A0A5J4KHM0_9CHLR|nr:hypothetical protein KDW_05140 [Dictyobacter vulcani]
MTHIDDVLEGTTPLLHPFRVCMYTVRKASSDVRAMRSASALVTAGLAVSIIDIESKRFIQAKKDICGICVHHIILPGWYTSRSFEPYFFVKAVWLLIVSILWLIRARADIYHAGDLTALPACYIAAKLRRKPVILDFYECPIPAPETDIVFWRWLGWLMVISLGAVLPHCEGVIAVSPLIAREFQQRYHLSEVLVLRNILEYCTVAKSDLLRQSLGLSSETRIALYQGGIFANRRLDLLVQAAAFLERDNIIVMMGPSDQKTLVHLQRLISRKGVADRVKIIPPVPYDELLDWTASADIGLIVLDPDYSLSIRLSLPNKLFEYLMAGLPVLSSQLDGVVDILTAYETGRVVTSLTPTNISTAINRMLRDRDELDRMHKNAHNAAKELCWEKEKQQLIHLYQRILGIQET